MSSARGRPRSGRRDSAAVRGRRCGISRRYRGRRGWRCFLDGRRRRLRAAGRERQCRQQGDAPAGLAEAACWRTRGLTPWRRDSGALRVPSTVAFPVETAGALRPARPSWTGGWRWRFRAAGRERRVASSARRLSVAMIHNSNPGRHVSRTQSLPSRLNPHGTLEPELEPGFCRHAQVCLPRTSHDRAGGAARNRTTDRACAAPQQPADDRADSCARADLPRRAFALAMTLQLDIARGDVVPAIPM